MGQIVGGAAKPKRCNLNKLSQLVTPAAGEYILVSSDNSMNAAGQGNFDCYIVGDGKKAATELELKSLVDDGAFDISAYRATGNVLAKYVDLSAALDGGNNIPEAFRKGGISVKFVQSSDNKYVQCRLMADSFTTDVTQWQGVDDEPTSWSKNLMESGGTFKSINNGINNVYTGIVPLNEMVTLKGFLNTTSITDTGDSLYIAFKADAFAGRILESTGPAAGGMVFVKSYDFNHSLPYTYDLCVGQEGVLSGATQYKAIPSDCAYILIRAKTYNMDNSVLPTQFVIDSYNFTEYLLCSIGAFVKNNSEFSLVGNLTQSGSISTNPSYRRTPYLSVIPGETIELSCDNHADSVSVCNFYSSKNGQASFVSAATKTNLGLETIQVVVPQGASYMMCCTHIRSLFKSYTNYCMSDEMVNYIDSKFNSNQSADEKGFKDTTLKIKGSTITIKQRYSSICNPFGVRGYAYNVFGQMIENTDYACTELIPLTSNTISIGSSVPYNNYYVIVYFDTQRKRISGGLKGGDGFTERTITSSDIPEGAAYFACTTLITELNDSYIICGDIYNLLNLNDEFPELHHTIKNTDLTKEHVLYNSTGIPVAKNGYDAVKFNVSEGDIVRYTGNTPSLGYYGVMFFNKNNEVIATYIEGRAESGSNASWPYKDLKIVAPANSAYVVCQGRNSSEYTIVYELVVDLYSKIQIHYEELIEYDATMLEPAYSYYRKSNTGGTPLFQPTTNSSKDYRVSVPIPVIVDDTIKTTSTVKGSYDTVVNITLDSNKNILGILNVDSKGIANITQSMWDAGVRYVAITFKPEDTKKIAVVRSNKKEPFVLDKTLKMKIAPFFAGTGMSNGFMLYIPNRSGKYIGHHFCKYEKTWDSIEYIDGDGNTQTATDVMSVNVWNCETQFDENLVQIVQGNTNFISNVIDTGYHIGSQHGCEVTFFTDFIINGVSKLPSDLTAYKIQECDSFRVVWKSEVYKHGSGGNNYSTQKPALDVNGNPIVRWHHYLDAKFEYGNKITVENTLHIKENGIRFDTADGAMLECYFGRFSKIAINNAEQTINNVSDTGVFSPVAGSSVNLGTMGVNEGIAFNANEITIWGDDFFVKQSMIPKFNDRIAKCCVYNVRYSDRYKCYFNPVICAKTTEILEQPVETFNEGDTITVIGIREIEY